MPLSPGFLIFSMKALNEWRAFIKAFRDCLGHFSGSQAGVTLQDLEGFESKRKREWFLSLLRAEKTEEQVRGSSQDGKTASKLSSNQNFFPPSTLVTTASSGFIASQEKGTYNVDGLAS